MTPHVKGLPDPHFSITLYPAGHIVTELPGELYVEGQILRRRGIAAMMFPQLINDILIRSGYLGDDYLTRGNDPGERPVGMPQPEHIVILRRNFPQQVHGKDVIMIIFPERDKTDFTGIAVGRDKSFKSFV